MDTGLFKDEVSQIEFDIKQAQVPRGTHIGRETHGDAAGGKRLSTTRLGSVDEGDCWGQVLVKDP